jgi:hypothetical protein
VTPDNGGSMREFCARSFGCDLRSLAALRIALGLLLLAGLALRLPEFREHYTDAGAWPLAAAREDLPWTWSLYYLGNAGAFTAAMFAISALAAGALVLGWHTRLAIVISWVLLLSLQNRNALVLNGGDVLLRLLLFWGLFLPLGARWSLDAKRASVRNAVVVSIPTAALLLQVALVYVFNALYKTSESWRLAGTAIEESLRLETYVTAWGRSLLAAPDLLRLGTHAVWWLELLGPVLPFIPWRNAGFRIVAVMLFMGFHLALFCCLRIGLFPLIGVAAWLPFLPSAFWDRFRRNTVPAVSTQPAWLQIVAGLAFALVLTWNIAGYRREKLPSWLNPAVSAAVNTLRLDQKWTLFAPPLKREGWDVAVLECDENEYDAFTGAEIDWWRPASLADRYRSVNWRKFLSEIRRGPPSRARWLCKWFVQEWERAHPNAPVRRVRLHYLWEWTAKRQNPPGNQLIFEDPPGPLTEQSRLVNKRALDSPEKSDN